MHLPNEVVCRKKGYQKKRFDMSTYHRRLLDATTSEIMLSEPAVDSPEWLTYFKTFSMYWYTVFSMTKSGGGTRFIEEPVGLLKLVQKDILKELKQFEPHSSAHSVKGKGFIKNAVVHVGAVELLRIDIKDFYASSTYDLVMNNVEDEALKQYIKLNKKLLFVNRGTHHLPTGAPSSPLLATLVLKPLDIEIHQKVEQAGGIYSRYLDDLSISFKEKKSPEWKQQFQNEMAQIISERGWNIHFGKSSWVDFNTESVTITGVDVRSKPKVTAKYIRTKLRPSLDKEAGRLLSRMKKRNFYRHYQGVMDKYAFLSNLKPKIMGELSYVQSVSEEQYQKLVDYFYKRIEVRQEHFTAMNFNISLDRASQDMKLLTQAAHSVLHKQINRYSNRYPTIPPFNLEIEEKISIMYKELRNNDLPKFIALALAVQGVRKEYWALTGNPPLSKQRNSRG